MERYVWNLRVLVADVPVLHRQSLESLLSGPSFERRAVYVSWRVAARLFGPERLERDRCVFWRVGMQAVLVMVPSWPVMGELVGALESWMPVVEEGMPVVVETFEE